PLARREGADRFVRPPPVEGGLLGGRDDVVGWGQHVAHVPGALGVVAKAGERADHRHERSSSAAWSAASATAPARSTRTRSPSTCATVHAPPATRPPPTHASTRARK